MINHKIEDSTAKHLNWDRLLHYKFVTQSARENFFNQQALCHMPHLPYTFIRKDAELAR